MTTWKTAFSILLLLLPAFAGGQTSGAADALALQRQGKLAEAAEAWQSVIRQNPKDAGAFASLGVVLAGEQKYQEAAVAYRKALALDPKLPGVQLDLGLAEFKQGQFASAIGPFKAVLAADPHNT